jgi:hypothetical protein
VGQSLLCSALLSLTCACLCLCALLLSCVRACVLRPFLPASLLSVVHLLISTHIPPLPQSSRSAIVRPSILYSPSENPKPTSSANPTLDASQRHSTPCARRSKAHNHSTRPSHIIRPTETRYNHTTRAVVPSTPWTAISHPTRPANDHSITTTTRLQTRISHRPSICPPPNRRRKYHSQIHSRAHATHFCPGRLMQEKEV